MFLQKQLESFARNVIEKKIKRKMLSLQEDEDSLELLKTAKWPGQLELPALQV